MEDSLNFPIFKSELLPSKLRSMDEINEWIEENYTLFFDRDCYERNKFINSVNTPFLLE
jgi:hypothetical protein